MVHRDHRFGGCGGRNRTGAAVAYGLPLDGGVPSRRSGYAGWYLRGYVCVRLLRRGSTTCGLGGGCPPVGLGGSKRGGGGRSANPAAGGKSFVRRGSGTGVPVRTSAAAAPGRPSQGGRGGTRCSTDRLVGGVHQRWCGTPPPPPPRRSGAELLKGARVAGRGGGGAEQRAGSSGDRTPCTPPPLPRRARGVTSTQQEKGILGIGGPERSSVVANPTEIC